MMFPHNHKIFLCNMCWNQPRQAVYAPFLLACFLCIVSPILDLVGTILAIHWNILIWLEVGFVSFSLRVSGLKGALSGSFPFLVPLLNLLWQEHAEEAVGDPTPQRAKGWRWGLFSLWRTNNSLGLCWLSVCLPLVFLSDPNPHHTLGI